jgi:hypothetical protein
MSANISNISNILEEAYTKAELVLLLPLIDKFKSRYASLLLNEGVDNQFIIFNKNIRHESKSKVADYCAPAFVSSKAYNSFRDTLTPDVQKIWDVLIWEPVTDHHTVEKELGITTCKIHISQDVYYGRQDLASVLPEFEFMVNQKLSPSISRRELPKKVFFSLPHVLRNWLQKFHEYPEDGKLTPFDEIPKTDYVFKAEQYIQIEWPRVLAYKSQGMIASTQKNRPVGTALSKTQRTLAIEEFFPKNSNKKLQNLRTSMLCGMALCFNGEKHEHKIALSLARLFPSIYVVQSFSVPMVLPDLKGMGMIENWDFYQKEHVVFNLMSELPKSKWVPFKNIENLAKYKNLDVKPLPAYQAYNKLYYEYETGRQHFYESKHYINANNFRDAVELPFLRGSFFLLAAFGICELAYDEPDLDNLGRSSFSSWDGLRYVRRTALGDYLCGSTKEYIPASTESDDRFLLSPDTLLISMEGSNPVKTSMLDPYTERIGPNRFRTDAQIFLKNVRSKKELESKIELFKHIIQQDLPENWNDFFTDLIMKINPFEPIAPLHVMKIPQENKALIRLFAQDPVLKTLVRKAEGYYLIVSDDKYSAMKRRLQEFGYLLT